jgi:hypothetical protein
MSSCTIDAHGKRNGSTFILTCVRKVFSEHTLQRRWLPAEQRRMYMHMKYEIGEDIKFTLSAMVRVINKVLPQVSSVPNVVEIPGGSHLQVFRHSFQNRTRRHFFWVTAEIGVIPSLPSQLNATAWEQDCVLTKLLSGGREQPLPVVNVDLCVEPAQKRQKGVVMVAAKASPAQHGAEFDGKSNDSNTLHPSAFLSLSAGNDWWESGDACRLCAPTSSVYHSDCRVKKLSWKGLSYWSQSIEPPVTGTSSLIEVWAVLKAVTTLKLTYSPCGIGACTWLSH